MLGTIQWKLLDSNRLEHTFRIPGLFFIPEGKCRLFSPQHWVQAYKKATGMREWEVTDHQGFTLYWEGGEKQLAILLGDKDNVATMQLTPGYSKFHNFCKDAPTDNEQNPIIVHPASTVSDDEYDKEVSQQSQQWIPTNQSNPLQQILT
jgi:hypothetical protein